MLGVITKRCDLLTAGVQDSDGVAWPGGNGTFMAQGTIGSGGTTLQYSFDGTWINAVDWNQDVCTLTAAGCLNFNLPEGRIRASGGGSSSDFNVIAVGS